MTWSENLSVGIQEMDFQHKRLVDLINQLHDAMKCGEGPEELHSVIFSLVQYTKTHFADEEDLMQSVGFPTLVAHKLQHENLTRQVMELMKKFQAGQSNMTVQTLAFLKDWLVNHIQVADRAYGCYLNRKGMH